MTHLSVAHLRLIKLTGYALAATFSAVGIVFAAIPAEVLQAFNWLAGGLGWPQTTDEPYTLYLGLALAYMYAVTVLAWQTARHPRVYWFPWMLVQAKGASAMICVFLFALQEHYLIYLANAVVDATIAAGLWVLCLRMHGHADARAQFADENRGDTGSAGIEGVRAPGHGPSK